MQKKGNNMKKIFGASIAILLLVSLAAADNVTIDTDKKIYNQGEIVQFTLYNKNSGPAEMDFKWSILDNNTGNCIWGCFWTAEYNPIIVPPGGNYSWTWDQKDENGIVGPGLYKGTLGGYYSNVFEITTIHQDKPKINSVILSNMTPNIGDFITVTVNTTDNIGIAKVAANDSELMNQGADIWSGNIAAEEGTHNIHIVVFDTTGNNVTDDSASYTATTLEQNTILAYYRGLGKEPNIIETIDILEAADDWRNNIVPQGFSVPITINQLLILLDEWRKSS